MSLPDILFSLLLASLYGVAFYLATGKGWIMLAAFWIAAVVGFGVGEFVSRMLNLSLFPVGTVNVLEASIMSWVVLLLVRTLWKK